MAATAYVELVARRRLRAGELSRGLLALSMRAELAAAAASHRMKDHRGIVEAVLDETRSTSINWKEAIPRGSLTYEALEEILHTLDFDKSRYAIRRVLINEKLVHRGIRSRTGNNSTWIERSIATFRPASWR